MAMCCLAVAAGGFTRQAGAAPGPQQDDDLDAFMQKVLERRLTNWEDLYRYTLRDRESFEVRGPEGEVLGGYHGEFLWYVREGYMVRSPVKIEGAKVGDQQREEQEQRFLDRLRRKEKERQARRQQAEETGEPLQREYFLGFPFEPGNYLFAGRETIDGMDLVKIEYYPEKLFEDDGEEGEEQDPEDVEWNRKFAKASLVTLWVLAEEHQIVKVRYDDLGFDFLPFRWLVQVGVVQAEMTLHKPFADLDVWLPRDVLAHAGATAAAGTYDLEYRLEFYDYKQTDVGAKVRFRLPRGLEQGR